MALLSSFAGVNTEAIIKKRASRNINVQNFWLYIFGMVFNVIAICVQDYDEVMNKGFFHGYSFVTVCMILNHALSGIAVSMVMKYADNIVKVYSTSVAMLLTAVVSVFLFRFHLSLSLSFLERWLFPCLYTFTPLENHRSDCCNRIFLFIIKQCSWCSNPGGKHEMQIHILAGFFTVQDAMMDQDEQHCNTSTLKVLCRTSDSEVDKASVTKY